MTLKILLAGESWVSAATHFKGFDQFGSVTFHLGAEPLVAALEAAGFEVRYMPAHECATSFPDTLEALQAWDVIVLSDLGANTLLLPPSVWLHGQPAPNRVRLLGDYVTAGGGLAMIGGYFSFQGINGAARWRGTAVEAALPVNCLPYDDRVETPEGFSAVIDAPDHPVLEGLVGAAWPVLLGLNEVTLKPDAMLLASAPADQGGHPLLAVRDHGAGRTLAWASDLGPHWAPQPFVDWPGYGRFWSQAMRWLAGPR
ncbi:glutamine amidotransferase [Rubrimonas sp.]|uniref:glutamine amidotransferase n=1 Tax=Rubrimonas sp. TaxID=2036015 RepID=UPI002FDD77B0